MTQYEFVEKLSEYLEKNYGITIKVLINKHFTHGFVLRFWKDGVYSHGIGFDANSQFWEQHLYDEVNWFLNKKGIKKIDD